MASHSDDPPIVIDSDDNDEPGPEPTSLEGAINSATRTILANTLLEVCNQNDAARDIVRAMLLPTPASAGSTDALPRGTRRRASSTDAIDRVCQHCGRQFTGSMQLTKDCIYHPGFKRVDEGSEFWCDTDYDHASDLDCYRDDDDDFQEGFLWTCCKGTGEKEGCDLRQHLVRSSKVAR